MDEFEGNMWHVLLTSVIHVWSILISWPFQVLPWCYSNMINGNSNFSGLGSIQITRYLFSQISHATSCTAQFWPFSIYEYNRNYKGHSFLDNLRHYWRFSNIVLEWKQACYIPTLSFFRCKYHISKSSKICKESAWQQEQSNRVEVVVEVLL